jgi:hypothetical protein
MQYFPHQEGIYHDSLMLAYKTEQNALMKWVLSMHMNAKELK